MCVCVCVCVCVFLSKSRIFVSLSASSCFYELNLSIYPMFGFEFTNRLLRNVCRQVFWFFPRQLCVLKPSPANQIFFASSFWIRDTDDSINLWFRLCFRFGFLFWVVLGSDRDVFPCTVFFFNVVLTLLNFSSRHRVLHPSFARIERFAQLV